MRERLPFMLLAIGLSATAAIGAQEPQNKNLPSDQSNVKSCIVILGAVRSPARLELRRRVRLAEALVAVGGLTDSAASTIKIINSGAKCFQSARNDQGPNPVATTVRGSVINIADIPRDQKSNPYLETGDIVIVTELDPIYVTGSVANPRAIFLKELLTLTQAIKLAGGVPVNAKTRKIMIYRRKNDAGGISIEVDLDAIRKHRVADPILQPFDIIKVPPLGALKVGPPISYPTFDSRPLIPPGYRVIY